MINTSSTKPPREPSRAPLNPALKQGVDKTYTPDQDGSDPMKTVSVQKDEGRAWPMVWAIVTIVSILIALAIFLF